MNDDDSNAAAANSELEERLLLVIRTAKRLGLPDDDVRLLCYQTGIQYRHVEYKTVTPKSL